MMNEEKKTGLDALVQEAAKFRAAERDFHLQLEDAAGAVVDLVARLEAEGRVGGEDAFDEMVRLVARMVPVLGCLAMMKENPRTAAALDLDAGSLREPFDPVDAAREAVLSAGGSDAIIDAIEAYDRVLWSQLEERFG